jgi:hypothetical protein
MITYFVLWCYLLIQGMAHIHMSSAFSKRQGVTCSNRSSNYIWEFEFFSLFSSATEVTWRCSICPIESGEKHYTASNICVYERGWAAGGGSWIDLWRNQWTPTQQGCTYRCAYGRERCPLDQRNRMRLRNCMQSWKKTIISDSTPFCRVDTRLDREKTSPFWRINFLVEKFAEITREWQLTASFLLSWDLIPAHSMEPHVQ